MTEDVTDRLLERATSADFRDWYRTRRRRQNAREGNFAYNGPRDPPAADLHFPSSLLQCPRKRRYQEANAPAEDPTPAGHFWVGSNVETELVLPFLEDRVAGPDQYVTEGVGFEAEVEGPSRTFRIRGKTDPVITDTTGQPLLPTEVKTVGDIDRVESPRDGHLAQVHAYLHALSARTEEPVEMALLVYVSKSTFAVTTFEVRFDDAFWAERVLPWMAGLTRARLADELPPADPQVDWECDLCEFRRRCGQTDHPVSDAGLVGFIPRYEYPEDAVRSHLAATDAPLTPTLAARYPALATDREVADWRCPACGTTEQFGDLGWDGTEEGPPCPTCKSRGDFVTMTGPSVGTM